MKISLSILVLIFSFGAFASTPNLNPVFETQDEVFNCKQQVLNRSGEGDFNRCREFDKSIACYEKIKETCTEKNSGRKMIRNLNQFSGQCVQSFSDCW